MYPMRVQIGWHFNVQPIQIYELADNKCKWTQNRRYFTLYLTI